MGDERWQQTLEIFHRVLESKADGRGRVLDEACGSDLELRRSVEALLAGHHDAPSVLDQPFLAAALFEDSDALGDLATEDPRIGHRVGPYLVEELLGEGGMGAVYRASQETPIQRVVALKLIQLGMATREVIARFESERQTLALLDHPNIARVYDAGASEQGHPYFAMELVDGESITRYCDHHTLDIRQRLGLAIRVCRAVHHAHQKGIVHRDLKPSNILVAEHDGEPVPKVIDFGVARAVDPGELSASGLTQLGRFLGTPEYMSPEQAESAWDVDIRTDVYSLGVVLHELLVGVLPFESESLRSGTPDRLGRLLRDSDPRPPSTRADTGAADDRDRAARRKSQPSGLRRELAGDLDWIVLKALEKDRDRRYGTASELAQDLERHLRHEPVLAGPPELAYRVGKFVRRHWLGVVVASSAVLFLVVFAVVTSWQASELRGALERSEREARKAEEVTEILTGLFDTANPAETRGQEISAREILERGRERIRSSLAEQPEIRAAMLSALGEIYVHLGLFAEAESLLVEGLEIQVDFLAADHPDLAASHDLLAFLRLQQDRLEVAEDHARQALAVHRAGGFGGDVEEANYQTRLGTILRAAGRYEESESSLLAAIAIWNGTEEAQSPTAIGPRSELGVTLRSLGRFEESAALLGETIDRSARHLPEDHPELVTMRLNLAGVLGDLDRHDEAKALLQEVLESRRRVYGDEHQVTALALSDLAASFLDLGEIDRAIDLYHDVLAMRRRLQGSEHSDVAVALTNLGVALRRSGRYDEAEACYRQSLDLNLRILGADHPTVALSRQNLSIVLYLLDRKSEAETEIRGTLGILLPTLGEDHPAVAGARSLLGKILLETEQFVEAEAILRATLATQLEILPAGHSQIQTTKSYLGECLTRLGRYAEAESELLAADRRYLETLGPDHESSRGTAKALARLYRSWGRPGEAERYLERVASDGPSG